MHLKDIIKIAEKAETLAQEIQQYEISLKAKTAELRKLQTETIPEAMMEEGAQEIVLAGTGTTVRIKNIISGSIPAKGAITKAKGERQEELMKRLKGCISWLEDNGAGDIIKNEISLLFNTDKQAEAHELFGYLKNNGYDPEMGSSVHAGTLNKYLREAMGDGKDVPIDLFEIFTGQVAEFIPQKIK